MSNVQGDPNWICDTVKTQALACLTAQGDSAYTGLTALAYDPVDPSVVTASLPRLVVDFSFPTPSTFDRADQMTEQTEKLTIKYFHQIAANDAGGEQATRAVRKALWVLKRLLARNASLWGTVAASRLAAAKIEDIPADLVRSAGVTAKWGWVQVDVKSRVLPLT